MFQDWQLVHVAFKSFDLNLLMAHSAIFSKRVCHQMICDNWCTATCMNCHSANSTDSTENLTQKVSLEILKLNKLLLNIKGCFPNWCDPYDVIRDAPLMHQQFRHIKFRYYYFIPYYPLFLMIPFNIDHNSASYNTINEKIFKCLNITLFTLVTVPSIQIVNICRDSQLVTLTCWDTVCVRYHDKGTQNAIINYYESRAMAENVWGQWSSG